MARQVDALVAELVGTFLLVFIGGGAGILAPVGSSGMLIPALAHGLALFIIVCIVGGISGAHVNPAVTLSLASIGKFSWMRVPGYLVAQFVGAALGALAVVGIYGVDVKSSVAPTLTKGVGLGTGVLAEALGAGILIIAVVVAVADPRRSLPNGFAGLVIGLALAAAVFVVGPVTGAGLNPALSLSPYAVDFLFHYMHPLGVDQLAAYLVGPIVGGVIAAFLYCFMARMPIGQGVSSRQSAKQPVQAKRR
jgi:glycerol uptake facilitator protein